MKTCPYIINGLEEIVVLKKFISKIEWLLLTVKIWHRIFFFLAFLYFLSLFSPFCNKYDLSLLVNLIFKLKKFFLVLLVYQLFHRASPEKS
jgi:hypothetical protein